MLPTSKIEEVSLTCFVFDVVKLKKVGTSRRIAMFFDVVKFRKGESLTEQLLLNAAREIERQKEKQKDRQMDRQKGRKEDRQMMDNDKVNDSYNYATATTTSTNAIRRGYI